jgi:inosine/xanthosine triphosphatase
VEIALGSTNAVKLLALRWALERLGLDVEPLAVAVASGVAEQPLSEAETTEGALVRARAARQASGAALGVGIEGGVDIEGGWIVNVAAISDGEREALGRSPGVQLPADWLAALKAGETLGELIEAHYGPVARELGAMGVFTGGVLNRKEASAQAALAALGRYFALLAESRRE